MRSFAETIDWYNSVENRRWKRVYHGVELMLIAITGLIIIGVLSIHGDGTGLQSLLMLFILLISLVSAAVAVAMFTPYFKRWHIFVITLGLGCGVGVSALSSLFLLELQLVDI